MCTELEHVDMSHKLELVWKQEKQMLSLSASLMVDIHATNWYIFMHRNLFVDLFKFYKFLFWLSVYTDNAKYNTNNKHQDVSINL